MKTCPKCGYIGEDEKFVINGNTCRKCASKISGEWQRKNKDKVAVRNKKYRDKNPGYWNKYFPSYYHKNKSKFLERGRKWGADNRDKSRIRCKKWRDNNLTKSRISKLNWYYNNPEKSAMHNLSKYMPKELITKEILETYILILKYKRDVKQKQTPSAIISPVEIQNS